jgi:hypothetical protein
MANFGLIWLKLTVLSEIIIFAQKIEKHYSIKKTVHIDLDYGKCYYVKLTKKDELLCISECNRDDQCSSCAYSNDSTCFLYSYNKESNIDDDSGIIVNLYKKKCKNIIFLKIFIV